MKRYDFTSDDVCHNGCRIEEFDDGEWVKWEDAENEIKAAYESGYFTGQNSKWTVCTCDMAPCTCGAAIGSLELRSKCNCQEMANKSNYENDPDGLSPVPIYLSLSWICPVHGYKRR